MAIKKQLIDSLSKDMLFQVIEACSKLPSVREEVIKNHDDNQWWPLAVKDQRLRMVIAGWSTRVSYNMISTYQRVVSIVNEIGYEKLCAISDNELHRLIGSLGLFKGRIEYLRSLQNFLEEFEVEHTLSTEISNDYLIELFAKNVKGASYKVAQCAVLYARGYHCGIFPVDSGMKDMLGPCLGLYLPNKPVAHEIMRRRIETLLNCNPLEYYELTKRTGYSDLAIPKNKAPIWWAHLVLVYFKRLYCNKRHPRECPLRKNPEISKCMGAMCDRHSPQAGGYNYVVLEGIDKVGKTTVAKKLGHMGYSIVHSFYNPYHPNILYTGTNLTFSRLSKV